MKAAAAAGALALALAVPTLTLGGYTDASRLLFVVLAGLALLGAIAADETRATAFARTAPVAALAALAVLSAVSAAWSIEATDSFRWALVIAGYAALTIAAAVCASNERGLRILATLVAAVAVAAGLFGLIGWALRSEPFAQEIYGVWRAGGPFEYPPTLALVEVCALPSLAWGMSSGRRLVALGAAVGAVVAVAAIAVSGSRTGLALAAAVLVGVVSDRLASRRTVVALVAVLLTIVAALAIAHLTTRIHAGGGFTHGRIDQWRDAIDTGADRPLVGHGADAYLAAAGSGQPRYAHDLVVETWVELGAVGTLVVAVLYATTLRAVWLARRTAAGRLFGPAVVAFLLANLLDWPWHQAGAGALFAITLGALIGGYPVPVAKPPNGC